MEEEIFYPHSYVIKGDENRVEPSEYLTPIVSLPYMGRIGFRLHK